MYESIWEPIEQSKLVKGKELILIRDGLLNYLPFELLVRDGIQQDYRDYHYLVKDYSFTYYPSATVLHFSRTQAAPVPNWQKSFLGFALSEFSHDHCLSSGLLLDDLEQAITEATTIANEFGPDQATVWTNAQATEDQLTSAKPHLYRYLHFATHGLVNTTQADYSRILLWPTTESDGCLNLYELFNQKWNADLVSLSACETGLGQLVKGEGMIGFTRALLYAGTRSVVLSLWEVADESTRELFVRYYDSLSRDGWDKYGALREVQLSMIAGGGAWSNPYYWAPFVFIGERYGSK